MENKIVTAIFKDSTHTKVSDVWQYDYGQILRIQGLDLPTAVEVDFAVAGASESIARIGTTKDGVTDVVIPDSLIETGKNLVAYIYLRDSASGNTEYQIDMLVTKRAKPEAYDTPEDKELFGQAIEAVNAAADRAEKAGKTAQEAATKTGQDAEQTAQDRVEVAKMVETVTDISEQVKKVEDLSNKAQAAATKTEADAQQTAEDRVEVGKMLETVKDVSEQVKTVEESVRKAKESEQAAARHRTAVEEMKNSVEQTASGITQVVQTGVQEINSAKQSAVQEVTQTGTAQKTAVEGAGTQAVENVENVKASATEAVETAKTEAVQSVQTEGNTQTGNVTTEGTKQVKAVQDKGNEVLQSIPEDFQMQMESKLDKQQGVENKGKALVIGEDGNVAPGEVQSGGGIAIINTMSGESPLAIPDSAERVNKGLELGGKTEQNQDPPPSPEYLQEIKNSGKWNERTRKYEVSVKISNKNLFDLKKIKNGFVTSTGNGFNIMESSVYPKSIYLDMVIPLKVGQTLNISGVEPNVCRIRVKHDTGNYYLKYTANKDTEIIICFYGGLTEENKKTILIEISGTSTNYEPYAEQSLTLTSDRPITKWDRLVEQGGQIGWLYKSAVVKNFNGDGYKIQSAGNIGNVNKYSIVFPDALIKGNATADIYVDRYRGINASYAKEEYGICCNWNDGIKYFNAPNETVKTVDDFKKWLTENPLTIAYETESTEFVPLPEEEQNAIRALKTYYHTTVITADGGGLNPDIKVTYTADTKNYIDGKVSAKVASILRQYQADTVNLLSLMPMETQAAMIENDTNRILENVEEMKYE